MNDKTPTINETKQVKSRSAMGGWPMVLAWIAMLLFACHASTHMVAAGDTWVAMACGRHFLNHGVDTVEPFSANSHRAGPTEKDIEKWPKAAKWIADTVGLKAVQYWHPTGWVNQNWLTHVIFYWLTHESPFADAEELSFNTLVYWKFAVYIIATICVYYMGRVLGANAFLSAFFTCAAMFIGRSFIDIRPAGFSNLLVAMYLLVLLLATYKNIKYVWLIVPITIFWCNVHGGYVYVFIMLVPFVGLNFLTSFFPIRFVTTGLKGVYHTIGAGAAALIGSIVFNPFHLTNLTHTFVISLSKHAEMWRTVNEWHPAFAWKNPVGTGFPFLVMLILSIGVTALWFASRFLKPKFFKAPKNELEQQENRFSILSRIIGWSLAVLIYWCVFISTSFLRLGASDFFICAVFVGIILLSIYEHIYFISLVPVLVLISMWAAGADVNYSGRYIYPFVLLPCYVITHLIASQVSKDVRYRGKDIAFIAIASLAGLVLMFVIFNPFKFGEGWHISQFFELKRAWHPVYENNLRMPHKYLFNTLYVINLFCIVLWLAVPSLKRLFNRLESRRPKKEFEPCVYELPKIDLAAMAIAALTVYMAIRSRRFVTIAAIAACPVLAMLISQMVRVITSGRNFYKKNSFSVSEMSYSLRAFFIFISAVIILALGGMWGYRFKQVYLDPWPSDARLNSVFMRMTASSAKPFWTAQFIRDNKLSGKMFNYWTEGGFLAWGQVPDPETGKTPLQLFMDGRAQAAYEPEAYHKWATIMSGGHIIRAARMRGRDPSSRDYAQAGQWVSEKLRGYNVWLVLMPSKEFKSPLPRALEHNSDWPVVFLNNKQKMFVDIKTAQGRKLFDGIFDNSTIYPDEYTQAVVQAHTLQYSKDLEHKKLGLDLAFKAFSLYPSQAAMLEIRSAAGVKDFRPLTIDFCRKYLEDFEKNKADYFLKDGYDQKTIAALLTAEYLQYEAQRDGDSELAAEYKSKLNEYTIERDQKIGLIKW